MQCPGRSPSAPPTPPRAATTWIIANFKRVYPNVTVNAQYAPTQQRQGLLLTQFQAGNAPDVFVAFPGYTLQPSVLEFQKAGYLADLSSSAWVRRIPAFAKS